MASAFLNSTPTVAPLPVATMIDIGVASPSAHGQAMISTATALTSAWANVGSGPNRAQTTNVTTETAMTVGTKYPDTMSASFWIGRPAALGLRDHLHDLREQRLRADPLRPHHERAGAVHGRADHPIARALLDGDRLAADHRLVDGALLLRRRRRRPGPSRRDERAADRRADRVERHVLVGSVVADAARGLRREAQERPDRGAGLAARAQLQHLSEQHERDDGGRGLEVDADTAVGAAKRGRKQSRARASRPGCRR